MFIVTKISKKILYYHPKCLEGFGKFRDVHEEKEREFCINLKKN